MILTLGAAGCSQDDLPLGGWFSVTPTAVDFGTIEVGEGTFVDLTITNNDDAPIDFVVTRVEGSDVIKSTSAELSVAPDADAKLTLIYDPDEAGTHQAAFRIEPTDGRLALTVPARGEAIEGLNPATLCPPRITPNPVSFGNVVVNTTDVMEVLIENCHDEALTFTVESESNVRVCSDSASETFCVEDGEITVPADTDATLEVRFTPVIAGTRERAAFTLSHCDDPACTNVVQLDGLGIDSGFRCRPADLDFGAVSPGECVTRTVECENIANEAVSVVGWQNINDSSRPGSDDFAPEPFSGGATRLEEGDTVEIDVAYCPSGLGEDTGWLGIETDNATPALRSIFVPLTGTGGGPDLSVLPTECLDFGLVSTSAPARRGVLLLNSGFDVAEVNGITVDTAQTGAFSSPDAQAAVLQPGEALGVTIEFQPQSEGVVESSVVFSTNDPDTPEIEVCLRGEGINLPPCSASVVPGVLDFGVLPVRREHRRGVEFRNDGADDCLITNAAIALGSDPAFHLVSGPHRSQIVAPGAAAVIEVGITPLAAGTYSGSLDLAVSSPSTPFLQIPITATGAEGGMLVSPSDLRFGRIEQGCATRDRSVRLHNPTTAPITIEAITFTQASRGAFVFGALPTLPATIPVGGVLEIDVAFHAGGGAFAEAIRIAGSDTTGNFVRFVSLFGEGDLGNPQVDEFVDVGRGRADVLFVVDNSCSQSNERLAMGANINAFLQYAVANSIDYQIGVTTAAMAIEAGRLIHPSGPDVFGGPLSNRIIRPTTPTPSVVFNTAMDIPDSAPGNAQGESGLQSSYLALSGMNLTGHNDEFLRPDATLSVIYMSDEPDQSPLDVDLYVDFLQSLKPREPARVAASAIVGPPPNGCAMPTGGGAPAPRYSETVERTHGDLESICTESWDSTLSALAPRAFGYVSRFPLTSQPILSTIALEIDGVAVPSQTPNGPQNWTYDIGDNTVELLPLSPLTPGATVRITYTPECL